jgi:hypothetical protein
MRKFLFGVLLAVSVSAGAIVSGLVVHDHSTASKGGTSLNPGALHPTGAAATCFASVVASGGGDQVRLMPFVAGSGGQVDTLNGACSDYTPLSLTGSTVSLSTRTGVGTSAPLLTLGTGGAAGTVTVAGTLASTKACAAGYTRVEANFCLKDLASSFSTAITASPGCTVITNPAADGRAILIGLNYQILSVNAVGTNTITFTTFRTNACGTQQFQLAPQFREQVATVAGQTLTTGFIPTWVVPSAVGGNASVNFTSTSSTVNFGLIGYYD